MSSKRPGEGGAGGFSLKCLVYFIPCLKKVTILLSWTGACHGVCYLEFGVCTNTTPHKSGPFICFFVLLFINGKCVWWGGGKQNH